MQRGYAYAGTDFQKLEQTMKGYGVIWPGRIDRDNQPSEGRSSTCWLPILKKIDDR